MAKKKLTIETCDECPNFSEHFDDCFELNRHIKIGPLGRYTIPDDCPLEDAEED